MASTQIPIFPLSNVVLFPKLGVPLHIFEPRYRQMTEYALDGDGVIGMVTVTPDGLEEIESDPPVFEIGCAGIIRDFQRLPDGRFKLVLEGTRRFRVVAEVPRTGDRLYRVARVEFLEEPAGGDLSELRAAVTSQVETVARLLAKAEAVPPGAFDGLDDETFVNSLANGFNFAPREKQGLLEANGVRDRLEKLSSLSISQSSS